MQKEWCILFQVKLIPKENKRNSNSLDLKRFMPNYLSKKSTRENKFLGNLSKTQSPKLIFRNILIGQESKTKNIFNSISKSLFRNFIKVSSREESEEIEFLKALTDFYFICTFFHLLHFSIHYIIQCKCLPFHSISINRQFLYFVLNR